MQRVLLLLLMSGFVYSTEFLYPVAQGPDSDYLLLIYQKTPHHIELWQWDRYTKHAENVLLSRYTPAGLRILPENSGYSFIDNGRIRIKKWAKRSPKNVELDAPISTIELLNWVDERTCYTSGRYRSNFGVFQIDDEGVVCPLLVDSQTNILYPSKIKDSLFFVIRDINQQYHIGKTVYRPQGVDLDEFYDRMQQYTHPDIDLIVKGNLRPIVFLQMISEYEGFYLTHPRAISKKDRVISFNYHRLIWGGVKWETQQLLEFTIPTSLLFTGKKSRLYEALLPLLVRYHEGMIYYPNAYETESLSLYQYCMTHKSHRLLSPTIENSYFFSPLIIDNVMYYGGNISDHYGEIRMEIIDGYIRVLLGSLLL